MRERKPVVIAACAAIVAVLAGWPHATRAQEGKAMEDLLRPYLDPEFTPTEGPDTDKAFILETAKQIKQALPEKRSATPPEKRKVLLLTSGTYGVLHVPGAGGLVILLREAAAKYGAFELTELYGDATINADMLKGFEAVVLNNVGRTQRPDVFNKVLPEYVRNGGGLLAVHSSALLFMKEPEAEYSKLLGGYVDSVNTQHGHPTKQGSPFSVLLPEPQDPLVAAFQGEATARTFTHSWLSGAVRKPYQVTIRPPAEFADELYALIQTPGQPTLPRVLVKIEKEKAVQVYPQSADDFAYAVTWVKDCGKGRVFYTQFGHNMAVYSVPCIAQSILDGLLYAAGER